MKVFNYQSSLEALLTPEICNLISAIHEYKGKQELFITAKADALEALLKVAKIQSTEASNQIEGISIPESRLRELMAQQTKPQNRNEQEIAGYRDVLGMIHESHEFIDLKPSVILQLHKVLYSHQPAGIGGHWKAMDNVISEIDSEGHPFVRFKPLSAVETPIAMESLCGAVNQALEVGTYDGLLIVALFVLDFLSIHPFADGNGRMSRLLTLLLLYKLGYIVGKYISIERVIEASKETYYETLEKSSEQWEENANDPKPFITYLLGTILKSYRDFESRVANLINFKSSKPDRIRTLFEQTPTPLTKRMILTHCPDISESTVEATLRRLLRHGEIRKLGDRRNASYLLANRAPEA